MAILQKTNGKQNVSQDQIIQALLSKVASLEAKLEQTPSVRKRKVECKVGQAGGLVISGLNGSRYPVSLYIDQWDRLVEHFDDIKAFVEANRKQFKTKEA